MAKTDSVGWRSFSGRLSLIIDDADDYDDGDSTTLKYCERGVVFADHRGPQLCFKSSLSVKLKFHGSSFIVASS